MPSSSLFSRLQRPGPWPSVLLALALCAGCSRIPQDPAGTLERVQDTAVLRVGAIEHPPWLAPAGAGGVGVEARLITGFAASVGAEVQWTFLPASAAVDRLESGALDLVAGGLTEADPWRDRVAYTRPWADAGGGARSRVMAVRRGENAMLVALERFFRTPAGIALAASPDAG